MIKSATLNGKRFDFHFGPFDGVTTSPISTDTTPDIFIQMDPDDSFRFMETVIHEAMHGLFWNKSEQTIETCARDLTRLLRRIGFKWQGRAIAPEQVASAKKKRISGGTMPSAKSPEDNSTSG